MTCLRIYFEGNRATVLITPGWFRRMLGAREVELECVRVYERGDERGHRWQHTWICAGSGREVAPHILDAIDHCVPAAIRVPAARVLASRELGTP